ncbi:hypothetical protein Tco_0466370 [Tanacetum coccineum]
MRRCRERFATIDINIGRSSTSSKPFFDLGLSCCESTKQSYPCLECVLLRLQSHHLRSSVVVNLPGGGYKGYGKWEVVRVTAEWTRVVLLYKP